MLAKTADMRAPKYVNARCHQFSAFAGQQLFENVESPDANFGHHAQCDGKTPCSRCAGRPDISPCTYEIHAKHAKSQLAKEVNNLQAEARLTEHIFDALTVDEHVPGIVERLKRGESKEAISKWLGGRSAESEMVDSEMSIGSPSYISSPAFHWTTVTQDQGLIDHLFSLYLHWVHPVHMLFNADVFSNSFREQSPQYCSPQLVNAICAMACFLDSKAHADHVDFRRLGQKFSDAVTNSLDSTDSSLPSIQAFAVMFLVASAQANGLAYSYLTIAIDNMPNVAMQDSQVFLVSLRDTHNGLKMLNA